MEYCPAENMFPDLMTKGLTPEKHERLESHVNKPLRHHKLRKLDATAWKLRVRVKNYAIPMAAWQGCQQPVSEHLIFAIPTVMGAIPIAMRLNAAF